MDGLDLRTDCDDVGISSALITTDRNKDAIATTINMAKGMLHPDSPPTRKTGNMTSLSYYLNLLTTLQ